MQDLLKKAREYGGEKMQDFTRGMSFPASKDQIVDFARQRHLPPEVMDRLEKLPDKEYNNIGDVLKAAGADAF